MHCITSLSEVAALDVATPSVCTMIRVTWSDGNYYILSALMGLKSRLQTERAENDSQANRREHASPGIL